LNRIIVSLASPNLTSFQKVASSAMGVPKEIARLIERYDRNAEAYRSASDNEAQVRLEFIDPFFKCLGWDLDNEQGNAEAYKDVVHEDAMVGCAG
jgi:hypothetical protein